MNTQGAETGYQLSLPQGAATGRHDRQRQRRREPVSGSRCEHEEPRVLALHYWCRLLQVAPSRLSAWPHAIIAVCTPYPHAT